MCGHRHHRRHRRHRHHKTIEVVLRPGQRILVKAKGRRHHRHHHRHCC